MAACLGRRAMDSSCLVGRARCLDHANKVTGMSVSSRMVYLAISRPLRQPTGPINSDDPVTQPPKIPETCLNHVQHTFPGFHARSVNQEPWLLRQAHNRRPFVCPEAVLLSQPVVDPEPRRRRIKSQPSCKMLSDGPCFVTHESTGLQGVQ